MTARQRPVIVIPGVTASIMADEYPMRSEEIWSAILHKEYARLSMHPDDLRFEAREPALVRPRRVFDIVYDDLIEALRHDLTVQADQPTPVFPFPYDWRQDLSLTADHLDYFIEEVIARTGLLRHYKGYRGFVNRIRGSVDTRPRRYLSIY